MIFARIFALLGAIFFVLSGCDGWGASSIGMPESSEYIPSAHDE